MDYFFRGAGTAAGGWPLTQATVEFITAWTLTYVLSICWLFSIAVTTAGIIQRPMDAENEHSHYDKTETWVISENIPT
jgi:hypothetical protein